LPQTGSVRRELDHRWESAKIASPIKRRATIRQQLPAVRGSQPIGVAHTIYRAATDGRRDQVKYYVGPDATLVPRAKRLLGQACYFRLFKHLLLGPPRPWLTRLLPQGDTPVAVRLERQ